ncbi:MAG: exodeoxyribonuclease V subunit alpha [Thiofilum sp.]|uniref:exodeoxyribonuclease V subunit alpha n=1 Tax=Thiofilum sp. TaxID=2212733 RepID=UPI0025EB47D9|nr:exodeoxyribonuclease V subunit alpha [Thiofilum sp.]MBK8453746.1 exodeoxyribonuclease V subunit alpha [Thiofilum sp.]
MTVFEHYDPFARQLADLLVRLMPDTPLDVLTELRRLVYFLAEQTQAGIIAAPLNDLKPELNKALIENLPVVGKPSDKKPLIVSDTHAWFYRYWQYEHELGQALKPLLQPIIAPAQLKEALNKLFNTTQTDWQKIATALALNQRFMIISGGPGTGKTTTVTRILALLLQLPDINPKRIQLAAPTGKAAMRLQESIQLAQQRLNVSGLIREQLKIPSQTLHRLLGYRPATNTFSYHRECPLPVDVLVIDEASMMDIALMTKVLAALPNTARLILLGDKDQLAAVETGSVFRDLCAQANNHFSPKIAQLLKPFDIHLPSHLGVEGLNDHIVILEQSYRFNTTAGIGQLAQAIKTANLKQLSEVLHGTDEALEWINQDSLASEELIAGWQDYFEAVEQGDVEACFQAFNRFRILAPMRQGVRGTELLNNKIEQLASKRLPNTFGSLRAQGWYVGRPVMVTKNDYVQHLFNGDIGIALNDAAGQLRVYFPDTQSGKYRSITPVRLPLFDSAWAMTIHKSQGSEFDEVLLIMPDSTEHSLLGRELLYTGVTRARHKLRLLASLEVLAVALQRSTPPSSRILDWLK